MSRQAKIILLLIVFIFPLSAIAAEKIGMVLAIRGYVYAQSKSLVQRRLRRLSPIFLQDTIITKNNGWAQIRLLDGGLITINSGTAFLIEKFRYGKKAKNNQFAGKLIRGTLVNLSSPGYVFKGPVTIIRTSNTGMMFKVLGRIKPMPIPPGTIFSLHEQKIKLLKSVSAMQTNKK
jgi:hypothetical protein